MISTTHNPDSHTLYELLQRRTGLTISESQASNLERVIADVLASQHLEGISQLVSILVHEPLDHSLWRALIDVITIGETYFFRNQDQFNALRTEVFPALVNKRRKADQKQLRLWCAGCATGEEPYSLAMLLRDLLPDFDTWQIALFATDINASSLDRARRGVYRPWSFRSETQADLRDRWFTSDGDTYKIHKSIRNSVIFQILNLVSDDYPSFESGTMNMDLIMCRNVTIYFDQTTTREIASRFHRALNDEGWLVVGHAEPAASIYEGFTPRNFANTVLYQKMATETSPVIPWLTTPAPILPVALPEPITKSLRDVVKPEIVPPIVARSSSVEAEDALGDVEKATANHSWQRARLAADLESWSDALTWLAVAESEDKFQPQVYYLRALVQRQIGDLSGALVSLRQAIYCDASFAMAHYTLGEVYEESGDVRMAIRHWRLARAGISQLDSQSSLPYAEEITVEMLRGLIVQRLDGISRES